MQDKGATTKARTAASNMTSSKETPMIAGKMEITTPTDCELLLTRTFKASRDLVFDCMTRPELVRRWLLGPPGWTMPVCEIDLRVGGRFRYVWKKDEGAEMAMSGVYREIDRPGRIVHNETFDEDWTGGATLVTSLLHETDGKTTMAMTVRYASREARDGALSTGMADGMEHGYSLLDALLETVR